MERLRAADSKSGILILADRDSETGALTQVVDQVRQGGTEDVIFSAN